MTHHPLLCALLIGTLVLGGCASRDERSAIRQHAVSGDFDSAQRELNDLYGSRLEGDTAGATDSLNSKHGLLWSLDRGILATLAGDYEQAFRLLDTASNLVEAYRTEWTAGNITREIGAAVINDTLRRYDGNAYEHIQVEFWRSLNELLRAQYLAGVTGSGQVADREARQHYQNAVSFARRMVLNQIQETIDAADDSVWWKTYIDDPFARLYSAALMLAIPQEQRVQSDLQLAQEMLKLAWAAYEEDHKKLANKTLWRYETARRVHNQTLLTLMHRVGNTYDPKGWQRLVEQEAIPPANTPQLVAGELRYGETRHGGHGSVMVLNLVDLIAFNEVLEIYVAAGTIPSSYKRINKEGDEVESFKWGGLAFAAIGPGASVADSWGVLPVPGEISDALAPGGIAIMGTEIPVHAPDHEIAPVAQLIVATESGQIAIPMDVLCDLDAYARATLKDEQPAVLIRALLRTTAKQVAAAAVANEAEKEDPLWGALVGLASSLAMTATEIADLRGSLLLPNTIQGGIIDLPAGTHQLFLEVAEGQLDLGTVTITANELVILPVRTFPNPPTEQNP